MARSFGNWGRNVSCRPRSIVRPRTEEEIARIISAASAQGVPVKAVGAGHSWTDIACTDGVMVSLDDYAGVLDVDAEAGSVTVQSGISLGALSDALAGHELAMPVLGEVTAQSIAGAISTATHGTGSRIPNIPAAVRALRLVGGDGEVIECSREREAEVFRCAQVGLGALGIISTVTLRVVPRFTLHSTVRRARLEETLESLDRSLEDNDHVEILWFPHTDGLRVKRHNRTDAAPAPRGKVRTWLEDRFLENRLFGLMGRLGRVRRAWIPALNRRLFASVRQVDIVDDSPRVFPTPRLVRFVEMEYAVPRERGPEALLAVREVLERGRFRLGFPVQLRSVAADDIPLSPCYRRETCYVGIHVFRGMEHERLFRALEEAMDALEGRPHWGKVHYQTADTLRPRYPEWERFRSVRARLDPAGRFRNPYLDRVLGPVG